MMINQNILSVSLLVQRSKWIKILNSLWWLSSFSLASALNIEILVRTHSIEINLSHFVHQHAQDNSLSEPLLANKSIGKSQKSELDHASFLSKLTFAWINRLLNLGSSKTLALEDIPSLVSEDEADLAYQKLAHAWDSQGEGLKQHREPGSADDSERRLQL
ncbi:hypothetical protein DVH24_027483 [Malus domestica]|uniref:Uncharacterized protein n=1 Tax=Malus domestica TaxID=3750 RepID=A0A498HE84_MALDO|nr:hypothetical protein DVH24_027483 [Malus domestica]